MRRSKTEGTRWSFDSAVLKGLLALDQDRRQAAPLIGQLRRGEKRWEDLSPADRRLLDGAPVIDYLLDRSFALRFSDPEGMVRLARIACAVADTLGTRRYGRKVKADLRARAWAELGNAFRVAQDYESSASAFGQAVHWAQLGTARDGEVAWLTDLLARYLVDRRQFSEAAELLATVAEHYARGGEFEKACRTFVTLGIAWGSSDQPERAIVVLLRVLRWLGPESDLRLSATHALTLRLVDAGFAEAAEAVLEKYRWVYRRGGKLVKLRLLWLEGKVAFGLGKVGSAEAKFNAARLAFQRESLHYDAALVSLDLALLHVRRGRRQETVFLVDQMVRTFRALGIARETIAALVLLKKSCEQGRPPEVLCAQIETIAKVVAELPGPKTSQRGGR